jgi:hypothetical protein
MNNWLPYAALVAGALPLVYAVLRPRAPLAGRPSTIDDVLAALRATRVALAKRRALAIGVVQRTSAAPGAAAGVVRAYCEQSEAALLDARKVARLVGGRSADRTMLGVRGRMRLLPALLAWIAWRRRWRDLPFVEMELIQLSAMVDAEIEFALRQADVRVPSGLR